MANLTGLFPNNGAFLDSKTLSEKIANGDFSSFASVCECTMKVLDALKPIHGEGFLHLGISPDTIHFSDAGTAWLAGYNAAFRVGDDFQNWDTPFWAGYSASELLRNPDTKPLPLHYATDLYSIAAIFFKLLVGRVPKKGDWGNRAQWRLNNNTGYLKGASRFLVEATHVFLWKGLSLTASLRFSDVGEMRKELEKLISQEPK